MMALAFAAGSNRLLAMDSRQLQETFVIIDEASDLMDIDIVGESPPNIEIRPIHMNASLSTGIYQEPQQLANFWSPECVEPAFMHFSKLPVELRLRIWRFAAPKPHILKQQQYGGRFMMERNQRWTFKRAAPALLHVCRESRREYLASDEAGAVEKAEQRRHPVYALCTFCKFDPPVLFCPTYDAVMADPEVFFKLGVRRSVHHVAFEYEPAKKLLDMAKWSALLPDSHSVTQLSLVLHDPRDWHRCVKACRKFKAGDKDWVLPLYSSWIELPTFGSEIMKIAKRAIKRHPNFKIPNQFSVILELPEGGWRALGAALVKQLDGSLKVVPVDED